MTFQTASKIIKSTMLIRFQDHPETQDMIEDKNLGLLSHRVSTTHL